MDKQLAEDIYWVLTEKYNFTLHFPSETSDDYLRIKKERVKIGKRYSELKSTESFLDSSRIACVEWLMNYKPV